MTLPQALSLHAAGLSNDVSLIIWLTPPVNQAGYARVWHENSPSIGPTFRFQIDARHRWHRAVVTATKAYHAYLHRRIPNHFDFEQGQEAVKSATRLELGFEGGTECEVECHAVVGIINAHPSLRVLRIENLVLAWDESCRPYLKDSWDLLRGRTVLEEFGSGVVVRRYRHDHKAGEQFAGKLALELGESLRNCGLHLRVTELFRLSRYSPHITHAALLITEQTEPDIYEMRTYGFEHLTHLSLHWTLKSVTFEGIKWLMAVPHLLVPCLTHLSVRLSSTIQLDSSSLVTLAALRDWGTTHGLRRVEITMSGETVLREVQEQTLGVLAAKDPDFAEFSPEWVAFLKASGASLHGRTTNWKESTPSTVISTGGAWRKHASIRGPTLAQAQAVGNDYPVWNTLAYERE